jgi:kynurenine formamidase
MCAPSVIASVREDVTRRGFVTALAGATIGAVAATTDLSAQAPQKPVRLAQGFRDVVDLTHTFSPRLPVFPAFKPVKITPKFSLGKDGFFANEITYDEHTGTHMDAPVHFVANATTCDTISPDTLIAPLAVISITAKAAKNADATLDVDDIMAWEKQHGRVPRGAFVAMHSGWDARVGTPDRFLNKDGKGTMHAPGFSEAAARFLATERDIVGAGVDTLSLDIGAAQKFVAHLALLGAGKYAVELMANLGTLPATGATLIVGAPKHEGASGGPVRVLAVKS